MKAKRTPLKRLAATKAKARQAAQDARQQRVNAPAGTERPAKPKRATGRGVKKATPKRRKADDARTRGGGGRISEAGGVDANPSGHAENFLQLQCDLVSPKAEARKREHELFYLRCFEEELGLDIARDIAAKSAKDEEIGEARIRYEQIALELRSLPMKKSAPQPLNEMLEASDGNAEAGILTDYFLHSQPDEGAKSASARLQHLFSTKARRLHLFDCITRRVRRFLRDMVHGEPSPNNSAERGPRRILSPDALRLLADEWLRDPDALRDFLCAIFERWHRNSAPQSIWRRRIVTYQIANDCLVRNGDLDWLKILPHLEKIGAVDVGKTAADHEKVMAMLRRMPSDERKKTKAGRAPILDVLL